ncbi:hypothetical protein QE152_g26942 [Popillia japonica]|uniref:Reverse transcriptase n=1 Tax=Popillia japonica TaxID=7064 RepID=A0AAW1JW04_POPJA
MKIQLLKAKYARVFDINSVGKIEGMQAKLKLKSHYKPVIKKARQVSFSIKPRIEQELENLEKKVKQSKWATPIVAIPKASNEIRLCGDYKVTVNPNLVIDSHPIPTVEELFTDMSGGEKITKIDLSQAYLQLELTPESRDILTLNVEIY